MTTESSIDISVVIPFLNEDESLPELIEWIERVMNENKFTYEILLIDDGSLINHGRLLNKIQKETLL